MSGGQHEAYHTGKLDTDLREEVYKLRDAIKAAEEGYRGIAIDVAATANEILLPIGWKLVRAERFTGYR